MENALSPYWVFVPPAISLAAAYTMGLFSRNQMPVEGRAILVTGGSEGMGLACAQQLAAKGAHVVIVSRNVGRLEEALKLIRSSAKSPETQRFQYISADVSKPGFAGPLLADFIAWNNGSPPDIVWAVAGTSKPGIFTEQDFRELRDQMDLNFYGQAELAHETLRLWLCPDEETIRRHEASAPLVSPASDRHFIFTATAAAFFSFPGYSTYAPGKWAIRGLAATLIEEVKLYSENQKHNIPEVKIHTVFPGGIDSPGHVRENRTKPGITLLIEKDDPVETPEVVAATSIRGLESGYPEVTVGVLPYLIRFGTMGGIARNNWVVDTVMNLFMSVIWNFVILYFHRLVSNYGREHGHPRKYAKKLES